MESSESEHPGAPIAIKITSSDVKFSFFFIFILIYFFPREIQNML